MRLARDSNDPENADPRSRLALGAGLAPLALGLAPTAASAAAAEPEAAADVTVTLRITIGVGEPSLPTDSVLIGMPDDNTGSGRRWDCHRDFTMDVPKDITVTVPEGTFLPVRSSHGCYDSVAHGNAIATADGEGIDIDIP